MKRSAVGHDDDGGWKGRRQASSHGPFAVDGREIYSGSPWKTAQLLQNKREKERRRDGEFDGGGEEVEGTDIEVVVTTNLARASRPSPFR
ncbi:hypothetical protein Nepgr_019801 [Nepenthes gracilis]|uniref:Uncharacterized protein n=1 Tax=Nepenthes gracilis TaxID=150966 RepID=A0AAD3SUA3_NEPGR|nr:hypothetical protein Nepgr_019801 [Nepenthes gracilis]